MTGQSSGRYVGPYSVLHSRPVYENPWLKLREDRVRRQGQDSVYGVVTMKAGVTVLPVEPNGDVYLVREFKYALGDHAHKDHTESHANIHRNKQR